MAVRRALVEDIEAMVGIMVTVAEEGSIATEPPVETELLRKRFRETIEGEGPAAMWVLEKEGTVLGHAGIRETRAAGVLSLGMMILAEGRGRGGGRALLEAIIEHAHSQRAHKIELEVWPDNARAIALYTAAGFEVEGLRRDHYRRRDGSLRSALLMATRLDHRSEARANLNHGDVVGHDPPEVMGQRRRCTPVASEGVSQPRRSGEQLCYHARALITCPSSWECSRR